MWYALGALMCAAVAAWFRPWGLLLAWPGLALALVTAAYLGLGPAIFLKRNGRIALPARVVLGPYLLGLWLSRCYFARQRPAYERVAPGVIRGRHLSTAEARSLIQNEAITAVLDLTAEHSEAGPLRQLTYKNVPILDLTEPSESAVSAARAFVERHRHHGTVYVHCGLGRSRSATVTQAFDDADAAWV